MDTPTLDEQIAEVQEQRDYLARSADRRAGQRGFSLHYHNRRLDRLDAAIATLKALREEMPDRSVR
ncbi:hypothetical protein GXW74_15715 [Roseomonas eburnea]|uniref:Uncharacterized protein n=1 Tax=Neoroseomonas eburnea TaxID=1346889 RepID=A0A9X9XE06_9PROT|nr:hypothetical protein [Neoroseomonas eburnea]MBR0681942.1 hypothetical protein [Neoroseomonas eburnea]